MFLWAFLLRILDIRSTGGDVSEAWLCLGKKGKVIPANNADIIEDEDDGSQKRTI